MFLAVSTAGYAGIGVLAFIIYLFLLVYFGFRTIKGGHWVMFILGFFFFPFWIVGGIVPPKGMSRMDAMYAERDKQA